MNPSGEGIYLFRTIYVNEIHAWVEYSAGKIKNNSTRRPSGNRVGQTSGKRYMYYLYKVILNSTLLNNPI